MSPSHTMSAHWGKQIYTSWCQSRGNMAAQQAPSPLPSPPATPGYFGEKRSMDSDRSTGGPSSVSSLTRQSSAGSWFGRRS